MHKGLEVIPEHREVTHPLQALHLEVRVLARAVRFCTCTTFTVGGAALVGLYRSDSSLAAGLALGGAGRWESRRIIRADTVEGEVVQVRSPVPPSQRRATD